MSRGKTVDQLCDELFLAVEHSQGFAFISDAEGATMTRAQFFERIRGRLAWTEKSAKIIRNFLFKYGELSVGETPQP